MSDLDDDLLALADGMDIEDDQVQQGSGKDTGDHSGNDNNIEDSDNDDDYNFLQKNSSGSTKSSEMNCNILPI